MSLDVYLTDPKTGEELDWANITHNLGAMAIEAGIYSCLWRPDEHGIKKARQVAVQLRRGLKLLVSDPAKYQAFDAPNGWGKYENFVPFCWKYLQACLEHPKADVSVSR